MRVLSLPRPSLRRVGGGLVITYVFSSCAGAQLATIDREVIATPQLFTLAPQAASSPATAYSNTCLVGPPCYNVVEMWPSFQPQEYYIGGGSADIADIADGSTGDASNGFGMSEGSRSSAGPCGQVLGKSSTSDDERGNRLGVT